VQIGVMNHPARDPVREIEWIGRNGFDFVDLTLEPPAVDPDHIDIAALRAALKKHGLGVIVHTAFYLPLATPFAGLRRATLNEYRRALRAARLLRTGLLTVHFTKPPQFFEIDVIVDWCASVLSDLCEEAAAFGITVALENAPQTVVDQLAVFEVLFDRLPRLGLHLDCGHAQVEGDRWAEYLDRLGHRLVHVHLSDNDAGSDQHLPIASVPGSGIDWRECLRLLRETGYDGTITLEVFSPAREYLLVSKELVRKLWETL